MLKNRCVAGFHDGSCSAGSWGPEKRDCERKLQDQESITTYLEKLLRY